MVDQAMRGARSGQATGRSDYPNQVNNSSARIIHERFYCNRGYAAATGGLAAQAVNVLFPVRLPSSLLQAPVSLGVFAVS